MNAATTADQRITELRHDGVRLAMELLLDGHSQRAYQVMLGSFVAQARVAGIRFNPDPL